MHFDFFICAPAAFLFIASVEHRRCLNCFISRLCRCWLSCWSWVPQLLFVLLLPLDDNGIILSCKAEYEVGLSVSSCCFLPLCLACAVSQWLLVLPRGCPCSTVYSCRVVRLALAFFPYRTYHVFMFGVRIVCSFRPSSSDSTAAVRYRHGTE